MLENLLTGLSLAMQWEQLLAIVVGAIAGYFVGIVPGLGSATGVAIIVPFTFGLDPLVSLAMLTALYGAAEYGGSVTAILLNIPGEASAAATCFDGYALSEKGFPGKALGISITASGFAGVIGTIGLVALSAPLAKFALAFDSAEYFMLALFGITVVGALSGENLLKGFISVFFGLLLTSVGIDQITGQIRYASMPEIFDGIPFIVALIGLFGISEILISLEEKQEKGGLRTVGQLPSLKETIHCLPAMTRGSIIGFLLGIFPGAGKAVASFIAYNEEKRASRYPEKFGTGVLEGVAAPEAANNSVVGGAFVPLLSLGIPGSGTAAVILAAFLIHGLQPGPSLFTKHPDIVYGLFACLLIGNIVMVMMGLGLAGQWGKLTLIPKNILLPIVMVICVIGAYTVTNNMVAIWIALIFGIIGYFFRRVDIPVAPIVLALVLGSMIESSFRRALVSSVGDYSIFFTRPISLVLFLLTVLSIVSTFLRLRKQRSREKDGGES
ncbi:tripartite tricarboxylate transporter permease [Candidatus Formimonas warabiya]|uniref:DUF112 domain-containing protein n=1 Tax=Formimonas warabiya TaxID=1761012 RepID=A0A3G1KM21_FORW1|nr:tripartite tricarboxylate transporter permease [Candidatus Formimonas warabiya]ATW23480.1 hypothetical protein DCMF_00515 [Candidatus Formimonas warabiya]